MLETISVPSILVIFAWYIIVIIIFQGEKISTILKAANVSVEPYWPGLFAKALEGVNIKDLITNIGSGVGAAAPAASSAPAAGGAAPAAAAAKEEKKKEEEPEESDDDMGFGMLRISSHPLSFLLYFIIF